MNKYMLFLFEMDGIHCKVGFQGCAGEFTQSPCNREWYCLRHTVRCCEKGCGRIAFGNVFENESDAGSWCKDCITDEDYKCGNHADICQDCNYLPARICPGCSDRAMYLCEKCELEECCTIKPAKVERKK